jgi:hypothetical protein
MRRRFPPRSLRAIAFCIAFTAVFLTLAVQRIAHPPAYAERGAIDAETGKRRRITKVENVFWSVVFTAGAGVGAAGTVSAVLDWRRRRRS